MTRRALWPAVLTAAGLFAVPVALASPSGDSDNPWARVSEPAAGPPRSIGKYGAGCVQGAKKLPLDGRGYQVMRPSRHRVFGHPALVGFIRDLGRSVADKLHGELLVGDLGQPRGGPAPTGHSSHQTGLDVDLWYWHPKRSEKHKLSRRVRERLQPRPLVSKRRKVTTRFFSRRIVSMLKLAATDRRVARIFVNPLIKRELCRRVEGDRAWLSKIRPWWGHVTHFHVRLACPENSPECVSQDPVPEGDGCDKLTWWLDDKARADRNKGHKGYQKRVRELPEMPERCRELTSD